MSWRHRAACLGQPIELFFAERGQQKNNQAAKAICQACSVRLDCLDFAMSFPYKDLPGIYGGLSELERHEIRSRRYTG
jgi:WhiB family redox-sensing transcriptional regulator